MAAPTPVDENLREQLTSEQVRQLQRARGPPCAVPAPADTTALCC